MPMYAAQMTNRKGSRFVHTSILWRLTLWGLLLSSLLMLLWMPWGGGRVASAGAASTPPTLLSARVVDQCVKHDTPAPCIDGSILSFDASIDGRVVVFASDSNRLVAGDGNDAVDIFLWREGEKVQRVSVGANSEEGNHHSDRPALSGNGRYLYFRSQASNFIEGAQPDRVNLYLKELATGRIALVSRALDGKAINGFSQTNHFTWIDTDYSGRYVVFASDADNYTSVIDTNKGEDIFLADLDPDANGDYFDQPAKIHALSVIDDGTATGNLQSIEPSIAQDGSAVVWITRATDLADGLESNGHVADVLFARYAKFPNGQVDPTFDVATRTLITINRMGDDSNSLTPQGARVARIDPWRDQVAFVTADNLPATGDDHAGEDIYLSVGAADNPLTREMIWVSHAYSSSSPLALSVGWDPSMPPAPHSQVAWAAQASVAQSGVRAVDDLLIQRDAPLYPPGWSRVNWLNASTPSDEAVIDALISADGRYAFWTTLEDYGLEVPADSVNLFRRPIAPPQDVTLTVHAVGGEISYQPRGTLINSVMHYSATTHVTLIPHAQVGYRFREWAATDESTGITATVSLYTSRVVTARFDAMTPPQVADVVLTMAEDAEAQEFTLAITDPDPNESYWVYLVDDATHGNVEIEGEFIRYQPEPDFYGTDRFTLQVIDAYGLTLARPAQVSILVTPVNDPPFAASAWGEGANNSAGIPLTVIVQDVDTDDSYTLAIETRPVHGSVEIVSQLHAQSFLYQPSGGFVGVDSFIFRAIDSANASITGTATITIYASNPVTESTAALHLPMLRQATNEASER